MTANLTHREVVEVLGEIEPDTVARIIATGATIADLEEVRMWLAGADDAMGELERPLSGLAAEIFELLEAEEPQAEER